MPAKDLVIDLQALLSKAAEEITEHRVKARRKK